MQRAGKLPPGVREPDDYAKVFHQPSGLADNAENLVNLTPGYYERLALGKSPEWIKVYIKGRIRLRHGRKAGISRIQRPSALPENRAGAGPPVYRGWDWADP